MKHQTPPALRHLETRLAELRATDLFRTRPDAAADPAQTFCSNDYLGLATSQSAAVGAGASRLIVGERSAHGALERALATWLDVPAVLLFSSGYAANLGVLTALLSPDDIVISDALNHASIIDGCRLSRAHVEVVPHLDLNRTSDVLRRPRAGRAWVVTESYFSMDADTPDLGRLRRLCDESGAGLIVDEAHALGVFGPRGRGLALQLPVDLDVLVGTLGKSFGGAGAFVAGSQALIDWLWNRARSFVFSTGMSPLVANAALRALPSVADDDALRARLHENVRALRSGLEALGLRPLGYGPIIPLLVGDSARALRGAAALRDAGVHVQAIRPPTVPVGGARIRLTATARHTAEDISSALRGFARSIEWLRPSS